MNDRANVNQSLRTLAGWFSMNYRGCLIHRMDGGKFKVFNQVFDSLDSAKQYLDTPLKDRA